MNELLILFGFMALLVVGVLGVVALIAFVNAFSCTVPVLTVTSLVWLIVAGFIEFIRMVLGWVLYG